MTEISLEFDVPASGESVELQFVDHTHYIDEVISLDTALASKADVEHVHVIADVSGLADSLENLEAELTICRWRYV